MFTLPFSPQPSDNLHASSAVLGVMDSGVGGLAVLRALQELDPQRAYVFLADTAWMPYGERPQADLRKRIWQLFNALKERHGIEQMVLGCNTASASTHRLPDQTSLSGSLLDIVAPTVRHTVATVGRNYGAKVAMMATVTTTRSHRYEEYLHFYEAPFQFQAFACPGLASAIEGQGDESVETLVHRSLEPILRWGADYVLLGCTHYLHIEALIRQVVGATIQVINPAPTIAREVLEPLGINAPSSQSQPVMPVHYYTTGKLEVFRQAMAQLPGWAEAAEQLGWIPLD